MTPYQESGSVPGEPGPGWLRLATSPTIVRRGLKYAVVVGSVLIAINYGDRILRGDVGTPEAVKMALTIVVPYVVSVLSSVGAVEEVRRRSRGC